MEQGIATGAKDRMMFLSLSLVAVFLFSAIFRGIDPHVDEAMLIANLQTMSAGDVFTAMPLYEQASPVGYTFLALVVADLPPAQNIIALRILSALAMVISAILICWVVAKRGRAEIAPTAVLLTCLAPLPLLYGVTIKHYVFEVLAMSLALVGAAVAIEARGRTCGALVFLGFLIPSLLFAMAAPLIIGAVGGGVILHIYFTADRGTRVKTALPVILSTGVTFAATAIWHLTINSDLLAYQFSAYSAVYDNRGISLSPLDLEPLKRFVAQALRAVQPFGTGVPQLIHLAFAVLIAVGLVTGFRPLGFVAMSFLLLMVGLGALSALGLSPRLLDRHLLFVLPLSSILAAQGLCALLFLALRGKRKRWLTPATLSTLLVLVSMAPSSVTAWRGVDRQQLSPLLAHLEKHASNATKVLVSFAAQPVVDALNPSESHGYLGRVDATTSETGWATPYVVTEQLDNGGRVRKPSTFYLEHITSEVAGQDRIWVLHTHLRSGIRWQILTEHVESTVGPCQEELRARETLLLLCKTATDQ